MDCCGGDVPAWVILFDSGSADITHKGQRMVVEDALAASRYPFKYISVVGYADRAGSEADNRTLSLRRAEAVRRALIQGGMPPGQSRCLVMARESLRCQRLMGKLRRPTAEWSWSSTIRAINPRSRAAHQAKLD
jgi:hypothetical protein